MKTSLFYLAVALFVLAFRVLVWAPTALKAVEGGRIAEPPVTAGIADDLAVWTGGY